MALIVHTLDEVGLDAGFGAYIEHLPAITSASVNLISLFRLHRDLRGAALGHLAIYEMASSLPSAKYSRGLRRLGFGDRACAYFDEHVEAEAEAEAEDVHEPCTHRRQGQRERTTCRSARRPSGGRAPRSCGAEAWRTAMTDAKPPRSHPRHLLDAALMSPVRFSALAALRNELEIDFPTLGDLIEADDSALSKAVAHLKKAGYISVRKGYVANRTRTWIRATPAGMKALAAHGAVLQAIATGVEPEN